MKKSHKKKQPHRKVQKGKDRGSSDFSGGRGRPTLMLKGHLMINQNVTSVNVKQINIAPTLSSFPIPDGQRKYY
jgi:hypothetical protein